jgi:hypothetical protein
MNIAWGMLSLALLGSGAPEDKPRFEVRSVDAAGVAVGRTPVEPDQVSFEVRVVDTPAALWREQIYRHCKRVAREGRSTVWTVDERSAGVLLDRVQANSMVQLVQCPRATANAGTSCVIDTKHPRALIVDVDRIADGPVDQAGAIAYQPAVDVIQEGLLVKLAGRKTAAGVRTHMVLDSTWIGGIVDVKTSETVHNKERGKTSLTAIMQLPQVVDARVDGDFEIPANHELLVSLGTVTTVDAHNKPVVMERLALIAARPIVTEAEEVRVGRADRAVKAASAYMPMPMPPLPDRSPVPIGPDGHVLALPPLPDQDVVYASRSSEGRPLPSPQTTPAIPIVPGVMARSEPIPIGRSPLNGTDNKLAAGALKVDGSVARVRFDAAPVKSSATIEGRTLAGGGIQTIRIPVSGKISIELKARVVPAEQPD